MLSKTVETRIEQAADEAKARKERHEREKKAREAEERRRHDEWLRNNPPKPPAGGWLANLGKAFGFASTDSSTAGHTWSDINELDEPQNSCQADAEKDEAATEKDAAATETAKKPQEEKKDEKPEAKKENKKPVPDAMKPATAVAIKANAVPEDPAITRQKQDEDKARREIREKKARGESTLDPDDPKAKNRAIVQ